MQLFALGLIVFAPPAAAERYTFRTWTANEGLSQASVRALAQDPAGTLWVGTQAGLNRFDGAEFQTLTVEHGLASDNVNDLLWHDRLWVATLRGASVVDGDLVHTVLLPESSGATSVTALAPRSPGSVWCGTNAGLFSFDGVTFEELPWPELRDRVIRDVAVRGAEVSVTTDAGLFVADGDGGRWVTGVGDRLAGASYAPDGSLWISGFEGVFQLQGDRVLRRWTGADGLPPEYWSVLVGREGRVWLTGQRGVYWIEGGSVHEIGAEQGLLLRGANVALQDEDGLLWIGGYGGLTQLASLAFSTFTRADGLAADSVRPILRDRDGALWVGTTAGLSALTPSGWKTYTPADGLSADSALSLAEGPDGALWVGTTAGLDVRVGDRFERRMPHQPGRIFFDRDGRLWVVAGETGPWRSDDGVVFEPVHVLGQVWNMNARGLVARDGTVWLTGARGLSRFDGSSWRTYTAADGLASDELYFIAEDRAGVLWMAYDSSRGLTSFDGTAFRTYTTRDGLQSDAVYSIGADRHGVLWIGTARGLDRFDGHTFRPYGPTEGYASQESNSHGFWEDDDGTLWFGTLDGLSRYRPALDVPMPGPPRLSLVDVRVGSRAPAQQLPWWENELGAKVLVRSYTPPGRTEVRYRVLGFSDEWLPVEGPIHLTNLSPGAYELQVRGRRYGGAWSEPVAVAWSIQAPLWQRPWFVAAMGSAALLAVGGVVRWRLRAVERANSVLQRLVDETKRAEAEARQANDAKSVFLATMSHELRTPLNAIIGYAEMLAEEERDPEAMRDIQRIRTSARHLLAILSDVLDLARIEAGRVTVEPRAVPVEAVVAEATEAVLGMVAANRFEVEVSCRGVEVWADPDRLRQVLLNLLTNAFKFTEAGTVRLVVTVRADRVWFEVIDSGIGIAPEQLPNLFRPFVQLDPSYTRRVGGAGLGLAICKELVSRMGGGIEVQSRPGVGSTFSVWLRTCAPDAS